MTENVETPDRVPAGYVKMIEEYIETQDWIGPAELPLVFHLRQLCQQLDAGGLDKAAQSSAYIQAFSRLDRRRPGAPPPVPGDLPGQTSIFDHMD